MASDVEAELHSYVEARYLHLRRTAYLLCGRAGHDHRFVRSRRPVRPRARQ